MKNLLVPIDFTPVTEAALQHALILARLTSAQIILLHIVKDPNDLGAALKKLEQLAAKYAQAGLRIITEVQQGKIEDIGRLAAAYETNLVYMGTHGLQGLQYLLGSRALQVVSAAKSPFIICQKAPIHDQLKEIVVPIDFIAEEKQILHAVIDIAKVWGARIHLFSAKHKDEFLSKRTQLNLNYAKNLLKNNNMAFLDVAETGSKGYMNDLLDYAHTINADLIAIINHKEDGFKNLFGTNFDQGVITNSYHIPVLIMNYKQITKVFDLFSGVAAKS